MVFVYTNAFYVYFEWVSVQCWVRCYSIFIVNLVYRYQFGMLMLLWLQSYPSNSTVSGLLLQDSVWAAEKESAKGRHKRNKTKQKKEFAFNVHKIEVDHLFLLFLPQMYALMRGDANSNYSHIKFVKWFFIRRCTNYPHFNSCCERNIFESFAPRRITTAATEKRVRLLRICWHIKRAD